MVDCGAPPAADGQQGRDSFTKGRLAHEVARAHLGLPEVTSQSTDLLEKIRLSLGGFSQILGVNET